MKLKFKNEIIKLLLEFLFDRKLDMKKIIVLIFILFVGGASAYYFSSSSDTLPLTLYGNVDQRQVQLAFIDSERVKDVYVQEGDKVSSGQLLAKQETRRLEDQIRIQEEKLKSSRIQLQKMLNGNRPEEIKKAEAELEIAVAQQVLAQKDFDRIRKLWTQSKGQAVSRQILDEAEQSLNSAKSKVKGAENSLALAVKGPRAEDIDQQRAVVGSNENELQLLSNKLKDAELRSPSDSTVTRRLLEPGDMANSQKTAFSLTVNDPLWVRAFINEVEMSKVALGDKAEIITDAYPDNPIIGSVSFISSAPEFTPKSVETEDLRTSLVYEIRFSVKGNHPELKLGMPVTVRFLSVHQ